MTTTQMDGIQRQVDVTRTVLRMLLSILLPDHRLTLVFHRSKHDFWYCQYDRPLHPQFRLQRRLMHRLQWTLMLPNVEGYERWSVTDVAKQDIYAKIVLKDSTYVL